MGAPAYFPIAPRSAEKCKPGTLLITCTNNLPETNSRWLTLFEDELKVAWGTVKVFVKEKLTVELSNREKEELESDDESEASGVSSLASQQPSQQGGAAEEGLLIMGNSTLNQGQNKVLSSS